MDKILFQISNINAPLIVRVMCASVASKYIIPICDLVNAADTGIDIDGETWEINGNVYAISDKYHVPLLPILDKLKTASTKFKTWLGITYNEAQKLNNQNTIIKSDEDQIYMWDYLENTLKFNQIQIHALKNFHSLINLDQSCCNFTNINDMAIFIQFKNIDMNTATKIIITSSICKLLDMLQGKLYSEYAIYKMEIELIEVKQNMERTVPFFPEIAKKLNIVCRDKTTPSALRIMCATMISNLDDDLITVSAIEIGILRPSDFIGTTFSKIDGNSWFSMDDKVWYISSERTKNRFEREIPISDKLIAHIQEIRSNDPLSMYMIYPFSMRVMLSRLIKQHIGITFNEIRASYFSWRETTCKDRKQLETLCERQGHSYSTAMIKYKRKIEA